MDAATILLRIALALAVGAAIGVDRDLRRKPAGVRTHSLVSIGAAQVQWLDAPEDHDYPAALSYLTLISPPTTAALYVRRLRAAKVAHFKSKDILRASALSVLGMTNKHVERDQDKILKRKPLSP